MNNNKYTKWIAVLVLALAGGVLYKLPYLKYTYYDSLQAAMGISHTEFGILTSAFGIASMICYFLGGWVADRFQARKLLAFTFISYGLLGFYYATFPSYTMVLIIHVLMGAISGLTYWSVAIKAVRLLGDSSEQGKLFGFWEGGKGVSGTLVAFLTLAVFVRLGEGKIGMSGVIITYAAACIIAGVCLFFLIKDTKEIEKTANSAKDILLALKNPNAWLIGIIIFTSYHLHIGCNYLTPYLTEIFCMPVAVAAAVAMVRYYVLNFAGAPVGGILVDKVGSASKVLVICYSTVLVGLALFMILPGNPALVYLAVALMLGLVFINFAIRGIYFVPVDELKTPAETTGLLVGFASFIGFLPDTYFHTLIGKMFDSYPGMLGYKLLFGYMFVMIVIALIATIILLRKVKKIRSESVDNAA